MQTCGTHVENRLQTRGVGQKGKHTANAWQRRCKHVAWARRGNTLQTSFKHVANTRRGPGGEIRDKHIANTRQRHCKHVANTCFVPGLVFMSLLRTYTTDLECRTYLISKDDHVEIFGRFGHFYGRKIVHMGVNKNLGVRNFGSQA